MDTSKLKLAPSFTFPFDMKFVMCKDRHLHIPITNVNISDDETPGREVSILLPTQITKGVNDCDDRALAKESN